MKKQDNEQLCALAQKGDTEARDLLLKNNLGFIRKTANEIYLKSNLAESDLSTGTSDLEQEGCLGLLTAIPLFDSSKGIKFLTYAAPLIRNAMTDLIRDVFSQYEQKMTSTTDGLALQKIRLDEILPGEERLLRIEAIADPTVKSPEQIYVDKETMRELYEGLDRLSEREQAYLLYRYGFTDDVEHTMIGSAIHFNLRENRAKTLEDTAMDILYFFLLAIWSHSFGCSNCARLSICCRFNIRLNGLCAIGAHLLEGICRLCGCHFCYIRDLCLLLYRSRCTLCIRYGYQSWRLGTLICKHLQSHLSRN